jgi:hypothetical protein
MCSGQVNLYCAGVHEKDPNVTILANHLGLLAAYSRGAKVGRGGRDNGG